MRLFGTPRDTSALHAVLTHGTIDELDTVYRRRWVHYEFSGGTTLLNLALANRDPAPYWDVMDVVGFLPPPGVEIWLGPESRLRLEAHLVRVLDTLG